MDVTVNLTVWENKKSQKSVTVREIVTVRCVTVRESLL